ncbi:MAG: ATP-binding protein [Bacteroidota bacterium]|nr:ATP-binding protein [Bacteroidota bacterium]
MKRLKALPARSKLLLGGLAALALLLTAFVYVEVTQSRKELLGNVGAEARMLMETLNRGSEITITAGRELDEALVDRMLLSARLVDARQSGRPMTERQLSAEATRLGLSVILLFDRDGAVEAASSPLTAGAPSAAQTRPILEKILRPVLDGSYVWTADGRTYCPWTGDTLFVLAHEREGRGGAVMLGLASSELLDVRKRLGIGKLVQEIGEAQDIAYVLLQDSLGILTASRGVRDVSAIDEDPFLRRAMRSDSTFTRIRDYADTRVFEVVRQLRFPDRAPMLSRIGLSLERVRAIQQRSMRRAIFIALGFFVTAAILLVLLLTRQRFALLAAEHRKVTTYTGLVLDNIADAVVAVNTEGRITVFNDAAVTLLRHTAEAALGAPYDAVIPDDALLLARTRESERHIDFEEITFTDRDGDLRHLVISTSIIRGSGGAVETIVAIARDFTERRRAQEELQRRDRLTAMGELAGGIAHEIRNPLNAIGIIAQRFRAEFTPREDVAEFETLTETIRSEVQRVNGIITQFLEFARPTRLSLERVRPAQLLENSVNLVGSQARVRRVRISVIADQSLTLRADAGKLQQVLINLLQNAIDAMENGGEIKCVVCKKNGKIMLSVADTGPGIPAEERSKIFNLYYTTKNTGTGLGLSIVHHIISEHGGEISVTSEEGHGTTFRILLPAGE